MIYKFILSLFSLFVLSSSVFAEASSCESVTLKAQNKNFILPGVDKPHTTKIYIFKNISAQSIWLDHPVDRPSPGAGWSSYLRLGNSSALLINRKNFSISCSAIKPGNVESLDCEKEVSVCVVNQTLNTSRKGTYWLVEDKSWVDLVKIMAKKGLELKASVPSKK